LQKLSAQRKRRKKKQPKEQKYFCKNAHNPAKLRRFGEKEKRMGKIKKIMKKKSRGRDNLWFLYS
jgi:hypothetical protein